MLPNLLFGISIVLLAALTVVSILVPARKVRSGVDSDEVDSGVVELKDASIDAFKNVTYTQHALTFTPKEGVYSVDVTVVYFKNGNRSFGRYVLSFPGGDTAVLALPRGVHEFKIAVYRINGVKTNTPSVLTKPLIQNIIFSVAIAAVGILMSLLIYFVGYKGFITTEDELAFVPIIYSLINLAAIPVGIVTPIIIDAVGQRGGK